MSEKNILKVVAISLITAVFITIVVMIHTANLGTAGEGGVDIGAIVIYGELVKSILQGFKDETTKKK